MGISMKDNDLSTNEKAHLVEKIQHYLLTELDCDVDQFDTEFFKFFN